MSSVFGSPVLKWISRSNGNDFSSAQKFTSNRADNPSEFPIIVVIPWMLSDIRHLRAYVKLYHSCGWDVLICFCPVINLWIESNSRKLAYLVLDEISKKISATPRPIVIASFSGGTKTCLYNLLRILLEVGPEHDSYSHVKTCVCGQIFDSCPIDFVSDVGVKFLSNPTGSWKGGLRTELMSQAAKLAAFILDSVFLKEFDRQRIDQWRVLTESARLGPMLVLFSKNDKLAPFADIQSFVAGIQSNGGLVSSVLWDDSGHVEHLRRHPHEYTKAVSDFLWKCRGEHGEIPDMDYNTSRSLPCLCTICGPIARL